MKYNTKTLITLLFALLAFGLWADFYDSVEDLRGMPLYYALQDLIDTNTYSSYDGAKVFLFQELDNNSGTVTCVYTGKIYPIEDDYSGQSNPNTEHTFAQSWFTPETNVKKSDLHHLFITTMQVNSSRGNLPFGNVASTAASDVYYDDTPWQSYRGRDTWQHTVFQVNPHFRGNTARAILYFHTRYGDSLTQGGVNMLDTMIDWHYADPPDEAERNRNDMLYSFQGNRNPFVDRPEFVNRIWNPSPSDDPVVDLVPALRIDNIYPNPFREVLNVAIDAKPGSKISAGIYNLKGQLVYSTFLEDNQRDFSWNGKDGYGNEMPSGLYFIRISGNDGTDIAKVLYTK